MYKPSGFASAEGWNSHFKNCVDKIEVSLLLF